MPVEKFVEQPEGRIAIKQSENPFELLKSLGIPNPSDVLSIREVVVKIKPEEVDLPSAVFLKVLCSELEGCDMKLRRVVLEYLDLIDAWGVESNKLTPYFEKARARYHKEAGHKGEPNRCKRCEEPEACAAILTRIQEDAAETLKSTVDSWKMICAKGQELEEIMEERKGLEKLIKESKDLVRMEKDLESLRLECAKLQEKIDKYPDAARAAEEELPKLHSMLSSCERYMKLREKRNELEQQLDFVRNEIEKRERHGKPADRDELNRIEEELKEASEKLEELKKELQAARPSFAGMEPLEIKSILEMEWKDAMDLIQNYDSLRSEDMRKLDDLIKCVQECEGRFEKAKKQLLAHAKEQGVSLCIE